MIEWKDLNEGECYEIVLQSPARAKMERYNNTYAIRLKMRTVKIKDNIRQKNIVLVLPESILTRALSKIRKNFDAEKDLLIYFQKVNRKTMYIRKMEGMEDEI